MVQKMRQGRAGDAEGSAAASAVTIPVGAALGTGGLTHVPRSAPCPALRRGRGRGAGGPWAKAGRAFVAALLFLSLGRGYWIIGPSGGGSGFRSNEYTLVDVALSASANTGIG